MPIVGFESCRGEIPKLTENFAGIGTREINQYGIDAIRQIYKKNFLLDLVILKHDGQNILYVCEYPAYPILPDGKLDYEKPITPNGCTIYYKHRELVDEWLKKQTILI
jgi:hypothetical protein